MNRRPRRPEPLAAAMRDAYVRRIDGLAVPAKKAWWDRYLRGAIEFRGIPLPVLRKVVVPWFDEATADFSATDRTTAAIAFLGEPLAEDKLTGVLVLERHADDIDGAALEMVAARFRAGQVSDWNTTDWLAVKALSRVAARDVDLGRHLLSWSADANEPLWLRRAGLVAFVPLAEGRLTGSPLALAELLEAAATLIGDGRRFAQTAVGWLLRELSRQAPEAVAAFVDRHASGLSREARSMATARLEGRTGRARRR